MRPTKERVNDSDWIEKPDCLTTEIAEREVNHMAEPKNLGTDF